MKLRVTDAAPSNLSYPYTGALEPGDVFEVDAEKGAALLEVHDYLEAVEDESDGGPDGDGDADADLADLTKSELYDRASEAGIDGRSSMDKAELIDALEEE